MRLGLPLRRRQVLLPQPQQLQEMERLDRRVDVPRLDVQALAGEPQPRRGPGVGDAVREREHARAVDEQPRAARLEIDACP